MNIYDWFKIFNLDEFLATGFVSKTYEYNFVGVGLKDILVTRGNLNSVLFDDVFLAINLNQNNPFELDNRAVYIDSNDDVWVGIKVEN